MIRLLSSDLNGTLVHSHTMQEMISWGFPEDPGRFEEAKKLFDLQTKGELGLKDTFLRAGDLTHGLPLGCAIRYSMEGIRLIDGFAELMEFLGANGIRLIIVSTGYTVTLYTMRYSLRMPPFIFHSNRLVFASGEKGEEISEEALEVLVRDFVAMPERRNDPLYQTIKATGRIELGLETEASKAEVALETARRLGIEAHHVAHMGDTMGDSMGIVGVARAGGLGIAFNYNQALEQFLKREAQEEIDQGKIVLVCPKGPGAHLAKVVPYIAGWERGQQGQGVNCRRKHGSP